MAKNTDSVAIYSRKSRFTGKGESIGNQVELCKNYIRTTLGDQYADQAIVFEDEGFSGGNLNRPDFRRMMKAAHDHRFRAVVVYRLDRISRNIGDFSNLIEELGRLEIDFISIRENFDTSTPMGRAMMYIASVFSQLERETIAERIRDNMQELAKTGRWLGGNTPTGYTSEAIKITTAEGKYKNIYRLKPIEEQAEIVRKIYRLYEQTGSLSLTEEELLRQQIHTKNGRNFSRFSIKAILQNPVYLIADADAWQYFTDKQAYLSSEPEAFDGVHGILAYNRTDQEKGRATICLPIQHWIVTVGQHPGLIPSKLWIHTQQSLEENRSRQLGHPRKNEALLSGSGILWCCCGTRMYPKLGGRKASNGSAPYTYCCKQKERSKGRVCNTRNIPGNSLDHIVFQQLCELTGSSSIFRAQLETYRRLYTNRRKNTDHPAEKLRRQQEEIAQKIHTLVDALADDSEATAAVPIKKRIEELYLQQTQLQAQLQMLETENERHRLNDSDFARLRRQLISFGCALRQNNLELSRKAVRAIVRKMVWDGVCAHILLFGTTDQEVDLSSSSFRPAADTDTKETFSCEDSK